MSNMRPGFLPFLGFAVAELLGVLVGESIGLLIGATVIYISFFFFKYMRVFLSFSIRIGWL
jgi:hypothetical protein